MKMTENLFIPELSRVSLELMNPDNGVHDTKTYPVTKESVSKVIAQALSIPLTAVDADLCYQSNVQWDSLGHINLMLALEKNFNIKIDQHTVLDLISLETILTHVLKNKKNIEQALCTAPQETANTHPIYRGLNNIYFDESKISYIDAENSKLFYRGYSIVDLVAYASYEEVVYLLIQGELPNPQELHSFQQKIISLRELPDNLLQMVRLLAPTQSLTAVIRTAVSALSEIMADFPVIDQGIAYIAKIPTIMGAYLAYKNNQEFIKPITTLSQVEYLLQMLLGHVPEADVVRAVETNMILQAEHESNASAFAARIAKSTEATLGDALTVAIATFSGMLHGGALTGVLEMLEEISRENNVKTCIQQRIKNKQPIYGFGHRVYRSIDPRSKHLQQNAEYLSAKYRNTKWLDILEEIKIEMRDYMSHGININDDFHACISYLLAGFSKESLVPVFIAARSAGWVAHILEQSSNNILIRPRLKYVGKIQAWPHQN